LKAARYAFAKA